MGFMGDGFGRFRSSGVIYRATCGTTTTAGYTQHWIIAPPLTMSDRPRKTWVSTNPREDPRDHALSALASVGSNVARSRPLTPGVRQTRMTHVENTSSSFC